MFAITRDTSTVIKHVIIEKYTTIPYRFFSTMTNHDLAKYDTVELTKGNERLIGFLQGYSYRSGYKNRKTISYANVNMINSRGREFNFSDSIKTGVPIYIKPHKFVLIEKNIIQNHIDFTEMFRAKWMAEHPRFIGGG